MLEHRLYLSPKENTPYGNLKAVIQDFFRVAITDTPVALVRQIRPRGKKGYYQVTFSSRYQFIVKIYKTKHAVDNFILDIFPGNYNF